MKAIVIMWFLMVAPSSSECDIEHNYRIIADLENARTCQFIAQTLNKSNNDTEYYWCEKED